MTDYTYLMGLDLSTTACGIAVFKRTGASVEPPVCWAELHFEGEHWLERMDYMDRELRPILGDWLTLNHVNPQGLFGPNEVLATLEYPVSMYHRDKYGRLRQNIQALRRQSYFIGCAILVLWQFGIEVAPELMNPTKVKEALTGYAAASKDDMMNQATIIAGSTVEPGEQVPEHAADAFGVARALDGWLEERRMKEHLLHRPFS